MTTMKTGSTVLRSVRFCAGALPLALFLAIGCASTTPAPDPTTTPTVQQKTFKTPEEAIDALIAAANAGSIGYSAGVAGTGVVGSIPIADCVGHGVLWVDVHAAVA